MFLALKEMRRAKGRFLLLIFAIGLLVFLILFQAAIRDGLLTTFVGGIENQSAPILVETTDSLGELQGSFISPELEARIRAVDGIGAAGAFGQTIISARSGGADRAVSVVGYERDDLGAPTTLSSGRLPRSPGEVVANEGDAADGFEIGDTITVAPGGATLTVVGQATDIDLGAPTVFASFETFTSVVKSANPDAQVVVPNAIAVRPQSGVSVAQLTQRLDALTTDIDALTRAEAAEKTPGVAEVKTSFLLIFIIFGIVIPLVTGLFFLIVTFQKANALTLLRAIGAPAGMLIRSLLTQVTIVMVAAIGVAVALFVPLSSQQLGNISLRFDGQVVAFWAFLLTTLGLISSLVAARRVLAIDPIEATTGAGVGR